MNHLSITVLPCEELLKITQESSQDAAWSESPVFWTQAHHLTPVWTHVIIKRGHQ